jgi:hypothetical protein
MGFGSGSLVLLALMLERQGSMPTRPGKEVRKRWLHFLCLAAKAWKKGFGGSRYLG